MLAHLLYQFILNSRNNPAFLFVILDEDVERIAIADQADKSCILTKINDRILLIVNSFLIVFLSIESKVFTSPKSCITRSSCPKSL
jgi:uncharacterized protein YPO0396